MRASAWILFLVAACSANGSDSNPSSTGEGDDSDGHSQNKPPALLLDGDPSAGSKLFQKTCGTAICHGPDGSGGSTNAKDLSKVVPKLTDVAIVTVMTDGYLVMPPQRLEDQQMADVLSYLRQQWGGG